MKGEVAGSGVSWPHPPCLCSREAKSDGHVASSFPSFYSEASLLVSLNPTKLSSKIKHHIGMYLVQSVDPHCQVTTPQNSWFASLTMHPKLASNSGLK